MLVELPLWGLILTICGPLVIGFIIFKMIGVKILYSIALSLIIPFGLALTLHTFDVVDGKLIPHVGDFFVGSFLIVTVIYWVVLALYIVIYWVVRKFCCEETEEENMEKIKAAYDGNEDDVTVPILSSNTLETPEDLPVPVPPVESPPIDIIITERNYDGRSLGGSLKNQ